MTSLLLATLLFLSAGLNAPEGTSPNDYRIAGRVVMSDSAAVPNAHVRIPGFDAQATDRDGYFYLHRLRRTARDICAPEWG